MSELIKNLKNLALVAMSVFFWFGSLQGADCLAKKHPVPQEHPRLLGSLDHLKELARERPEAYARVVNVARNMEAGEQNVLDSHGKMISLSLVCAIEGDKDLGRKAVEMAMKYIEAPIRVGHETFGHDMANCAIVYDLCWDSWTPEERAKFFDYMNRTVDANVNSETHVFHNAWYGYKHWGYGLACYATYYENPRAPEILAVTEDDYCKRAAPALELSGSGGGFAEGYYINYWSYEWLFFCEVANFCEGVDYYAAAPDFYKNRAVASMFEAYPGIRENGSRRPIPMGDSGGQKFRPERDKALSARRILVNHYRNDPAHQAVHAFNETTPVSGVPGNAYKDFLWRDITVARGDLQHFKLSHFSPAAGYVYARSSWDEDATYLYFKCGDRFTAHQHLDNGHFLIAKYEELAGDGGQYYYFGGDHDVNYLLRTIAHSSILVKDPEEVWTNIRAWKGSIGNDGGQTHSWPHHNGAAMDVEDWQKNRQLFDIADMLAFEDRGDYVYAAGDCSRSYSPKKLDYFTRQIVFVRPGTIVIFDRVKSKNAQFKKTWLIQAAKIPTGQAPDLEITNGQGRLFVQTVLPRESQVKLCSGDELYSYDGKSYPAEDIRGPAPECRVEISPPKPEAVDYFLNVLTATDASTAAVPKGAVKETNKAVSLTVGGMKIEFIKDRVSGSIEIKGKRNPLAEKIVNN